MGCGEEGDEGTTLVEGLTKTRDNEVLHSLETHPNTSCAEMGWIHSHTFRSNCWCHLCQQCDVTE